MNDELYDIELLNKVIEYNKNNGSYFEVIPEYEKILNARYHKTSRIKQRLVYLLSRYNYIWFCTFTFDNYYIEKSERTKRDLIKSALNAYDFQSVNLIFLIITIFWVSLSLICGILQIN